jgi:hypothetical protein
MILDLGRFALIDDDPHAEQQPERDQARASAGS